MMCASLAEAVAPGVHSRLPRPCRRRHRHVSSTAPYASPALPAPHCLRYPNPPFTLRHANSKLPRVPVAKPLPRAVHTAAGAAADATEVEGEQKEKLGVVVKVAEGGPRLVLKFVWMEKNIGLALDQVIPGHGTIPLSPYYFWPRKDAWEELKTLLQSKPWISEKRMVILLNQATDIINLWQQSGAGNL